jgi:methylmalonyl-CoA mutase C-terminal domain/subunit
MSSKGKRPGHHRKTKVLMAKAGLDYHDRGQMLVSRAFMKAGMEVIYLDTGNIPEEIVNAAIQEDVDVLGISSMTAAHMVHVEKIMDLLKVNQRENILVLLGGIIPKQDIPKLKEMGVSEVFGPSSNVNEIVDYVNRKVKEQKPARS